MRFETLHSWELSAREAVALQKTLAEHIEVAGGMPRQLRRVAGVDVSYRRSGGQFHAAVVVLDYQSMAILETATTSGEVTFPYVPGLLSFRELPILLKAFRNLSIPPDLILADAQGVAHPRRLGLASHLGLWLNLPTVGCAKSCLCGVAALPEVERGAWTPLYDHGEIVGRVVRTKARVKPLYISAGHKINLQAAVKVVLQCCRGYRLPEPIRQAHLLSNRVRSSFEARNEK